MGPKYAYLWSVDSEVIWPRYQGTRQDMGCGQDCKGSQVEDEEIETEQGCVVLIAR